MGRLRARWILFLLLAWAGCDDGPPAAPAPTGVACAAELTEALHAAAFHFEHGPVSVAREELDRARRLAGVHPDGPTTELLGALADVSRRMDEDLVRAHVENERVRMLLGDWRCLDEATHGRLHAGLPAVEGLPRPDVPSVPVAAATFTMGCDPSRDPSCSPNERAPEPVTVAAFEIDRTEVTQEAYAACVAAGSCTRPAAGFDPADHPHRPVAQVTWQQARDFCRFAGRRLPTEAEWELAARGTDGRTYPWGDDAPTCELAQTSDCGGPTDVGGRLRGASPSGALDMAGNVDEWVETPYAAYGSRPAPGAQRLARGGAHDAWHIRSTARMALDAAYHDATLGFRCAR